MASRQNGVILTYVDNLAQLEDCVRRGQYDTVKVVTGWGLASGWTDEARARVLSMVPNVIVRTVSGDNNFPDANEIEREIVPWYTLKPSIMIELGNEPNNSPKYQNDDFI